MFDGAKVHHVLRSRYGIHINLKHFKIHRITVCSVVFVECSAKFISLLSFLNVKTFINLQLNSFHLSTCYRKWAWKPKELTNIISLLVWKYHVEMSNYQNTLTLVYCTIKLGQCVNKSIVGYCEIYVITLAMVNTYFFANKTWRRQWVSNHGAS